MSFISFCRTFIIAKISAVYFGFSPFEMVSEFQTLLVGEWYQHNQDRILMRTALRRTADFLSLLKGAV